MNKPNSTTPKGQRIMAQLRKLRPFLTGSLTLTRKRCGNPRCRCAKQGPIHPTTLLTWKEGEKTRTLYVAKEIRKEVAQWMQEGKKLKRLVREMSEEQREMVRRRRRRKKPRG